MGGPLMGAAQTSYSGLPFFAYLNACSTISQVELAAAKTVIMPARGVVVLRSPAQAMCPSL